MTLLARHKATTATLPASNVRALSCSALARKLGQQFLGSHSKKFASTMLLECEAGMTTSASAGTYSLMDSPYLTQVPTADL